MKINSIIQREFEVAFSKNAQRPWIRITKYVILIILIIKFRDKSLFWIILSSFMVIALIVHFWVRYKTRGWTRSYGKWDYEKNKPGSQS